LNESCLGIKRLVSWWNAMNSKQIQSPANRSIKFLILVFTNLNAKTPPMSLLLLFLVKPIRHYWNNLNPCVIDNFITCDNSYTCEIIQHFHRCCARRRRKIMAGASLFLHFSSCNWLETPVFFNMHLYLQVLVNCLKT
jgi:hypothetical protein